MKSDRIVIEFCIFEVWSTIYDQPQNIFPTISKSSKIGKYHLLLCNFWLLFPKIDFLGGTGHKSVSPQFLN